MGLFQFCKHKILARNKQIAAHGDKLLPNAIRRCITVLVALAPHTSSATNQIDKREATGGEEDGNKHALFVIFHDIVSEEEEISFCGRIEEA